MDPLTYDDVSKSAAEMQALARPLVEAYTASRDGLKQLGVLRSERNFQGDYAEWLVAGILGLELAPSTVQKDFDALDNEGHTYQIKSRMVDSLSHYTSFDMGADTDYDFLVGVFFSAAFELLGIFRVSFDVVRDLGSQTQTTFRFRWNTETAQDPRIEKLFWPPAVEPALQGSSDSEAGGEDAE